MSCQRLNIATGELAGSSKYAALWLAVPIALIILVIVPDTALMLPNAM
ncbi:hypothetical protein [Hoeflea prorocentri]|uniref:Uncharacterized protein n=1 Tax=Hoeflea prorocentri TaxID=1922333 RepID=A0A9X3UNE7_9HYPH|nr:hypothetical protein [Hoeflea prorocentri]MCY6383741.1 hypothetical protein [Hoeflea prorocentri]MDA5401541.1 hypothetical protein [Hoeflea prorocentri]